MVPMQTPTLAARSVGSGAILRRLRLSAAAAPKTDRLSELPAVERAQRKQIDEKHDSVDQREGGEDALADHLGAGRARARVRELPGDQDQRADAGDGDER